MEVEQDNKTIKLHLDHYVHKMLTEYKDYIKKSLQTKLVLISGDYYSPRGLLSSSLSAQAEVLRSWPSFSLVHPGSDSMSLLWYHSLRGFVVPQVQSTGQLFIP